MQCSSNPLNEEQRKGACDKRSNHHRKWASIALDEISQDQSRKNRMNHSIGNHGHAAHHHHGPHETPIDGYKDGNGGDGPIHSRRILEFNTLTKDPTMNRPVNDSTTQGPVGMLGSTADAEVPSQLAVPLKTAAMAIIVRRGRTKTMQTTT